MDVLRIPLAFVDVPSIPQTALLTSYIAISRGGDRFTDNNIMKCVFILTVILLLIPPGTHIIDGKKDC